jgi:hypothetical protein
MEIQRGGLSGASAIVLATVYIHPGISTVAGVDELGMAKRGDDSEFGGNCAAGRNSEATSDTCVQGFTRQTGIALAS